MYIYCRDSSSLQVNFDSGVSAELGNVLTPTQVTGQKCTHWCMCHWLCARAYTEEPCEQLVATMCCLSVFSMRVRVEPSAGVL